VAAGEFTCSDPKAAAWRITALIDGLSVQMTVHEDVLTQEETESWAYDLAARELGLSSLP
jgi:hypothetical protein